MFDITPILLFLSSVSSSRFNSDPGSYSSSKVDKEFSKAMIRISRISLIIALVFGVIFCICLFFGF